MAKKAERDRVRKVKPKKLVIKKTVNKEPSDYLDLGHIEKKIRQLEKRRSKRVARLKNIVKTKKRKPIRPLVPGPSPIHQKIKELGEKMNELSDLNVVNKMDIIELKNEIESLKMAGVTATKRNVCIACGAMLRPLARFCTRCGKQI